jgi:hypothetical protein
MRPIKAIDQNMCSNYATIHSKPAVHIKRPSILPERPGVLKGKQKLTTVRRPPLLRLPQWWYKIFIMIGCP